MFKTACFRLALIVICNVVCQTALQAQDVDHGAEDHAAASDHGVAGRDRGDLDAHRAAPKAAEFFQPGEPFVDWIFRCMGIFTFLNVIAGFVCFILSLIIVFRGNGPLAAPGLVMVVLIPIVLGLAGTLQGLFLILWEVAASDVSVGPPHTSIADWIGTCLINPMLGLFFMTPSYMVAAIGATVRSRARPDHVSQTHS